MRVFFPDTNLRLPQFVFKYNLECLVSWRWRSEILQHLTLQVAALVCESLFTEQAIVASQ